MRRLPSRNTKRDEVAVAYGRKSSRGATGSPLGWANLGHQARAPSALHEQEQKGDEQQQVDHALQHVGTPTGEGEDAEAKSQ